MIRTVRFDSIRFRFENERTNERLGERRRDRFDSIQFDSTPPEDPHSIDRPRTARAPRTLDRHRPSACDTIPSRVRDPSSISSRRRARMKRAQ